VNRTSAILATLSCVTALSLVVTGCEESRAPAASETRSTANVSETQPAAKEQPESEKTAPEESAAKVPASESAPPAPESPVAKSDKSATKSEQAAAKPDIPARKPPAPAGTQNITFDTLKFAIEKNDDYQRSKLTPEIEALDGRDVKLRGYILPSFQQSGITQFVLVRDNMQCCFGPGAALYDCVVVDMKPGKMTEFTVRPVAVEGKFELRDFKGPDGKFLAIYHLDGEAVRF
jgi:hypothetical protein